MNDCYTMSTKFEKALLFLCSGTAKVQDKKLSYRIAVHLHEMGIGEIGTLPMLSEQHAMAATQRRRMIFINDCNASCVKLLTHGFSTDEYLYIDVTQYKNIPEFNIRQFVETEIIPNLIKPGDHVHLHA